jgi:hypothetical protein
MFNLIRGNIMDKKYSKEHLRRIQLVGPTHIEFSRAEEHYGAAETI